MDKKHGKQSIVFAQPPVIAATAAIVGPMEDEGLLRGHFDRVLEDNLGGQDSWEQCESYMLEWAIKTAVSKTGQKMDDIDYILAGDLLNQLLATHFAMRALARPFLGLYGACSTMAESLILGATLVDGGFGRQVAAAGHREQAATLPSCRLASCGTQSCTPHVRTHCSAALASCPVASPRCRPLPFLGSHPPVCLQAPTAAAAASWPWRTR